MSMFSLVKKEKRKARIGLMGVTGSGKTLSALFLASGMTSGDWSKIAVIDTERERARFYAEREDLDIGQFQYAPFPSPYDPDTYISYAKEAASLVGENGVVIIDSITHAWKYEGGILEYQEKIASKQGKNSYTAWNEAGKLQNKMINRILSLNCHVILTMRSKMDYILEEKVNAQGRVTQCPKQVGLAPIQRDDMPYELDIIFDIDKTHTASTVKDTTGLFTNLEEPLKQYDGANLGDWLDQGVTPLKCDICGARIRGTKKSTAEEFAANTEAETGKKMCVECYKEEFKKNRDAKSKEENKETKEAAGSE